MTSVIRINRATVWLHATMVTISRSRSHSEIGCQLSVRVLRAVEAMVDTHRKRGGGGDVPE